MILALDTSGGELLVCLLADDLAVAAGSSIPGRRHQDGVMEAVDAVLGGRRTVSRLDAIAVVRGPGSQTGLRVGMAAAEGLAFASRLPLLPLASLAVAAHRVTAGGDVLAAVSAGRSNVFAQLYRGAGATRVPVGERVLAAAADVRERLGIDAAVPVGAEPALLAAFDELPRPAGRRGIEALAAATREAVGRGREVAYHQLSGDYGE